MVEYLYLTLIVLVAVCWLIGYILHLDFGRDVLRETRDAESLKHAAEYTRSYRSANFKSITDAIAKLFGKGRPPLELDQERHLASLAADTVLRRDPEKAPCLAPFRESPWPFAAFRPTPPSR